MLRYCTYDIMLFCLPPDHDNQLMALVRATFNKGDGVILNDGESPTEMDGGRYSPNVRRISFSSRARHWLLMASSLGDGLMRRDEIQHITTYKNAPVGCGSEDGSCPAPLFITCLLPARSWLRSSPSMKWISQPPPCTGTVEQDTNTNDKSCGRRQGSACGLRLYAGLRWAPSAAMGGISRTSLQACLRWRHGAAGPC
jgi:hypothetical protein